MSENKSTFVAITKMILNCLSDFWIYYSPQSQNILYTKIVDRCLGIMDMNIPRKRWGQYLLVLAQVYKYLFSASLRLGYNLTSGKS